MFMESQAFFECRINYLKLYVGFATLYYTLFLKGIMISKISNKTVLVVSSAVVGGLLPPQFCPPLNKVKQVVAEVTLLWHLPS